MPTKTTKTATPKAKSQQYWYANGKRKTSIARVKLSAGTGQITVNEQPVEKIFTVATHIEEIISPLKIAGKTNDFDITVKVIGGGTHSQAQAIRHGIAKTLLLFDETLRTTLKKFGFLTRDSRIKERKKFGLKRARRAPQWQKR